VFLAQAFAREADLILLDEPAANLDAAGCTVIVATHDIDEAAEGDWTMLLAHRVVAYGPSRDILTRPALLATLGMVGKDQEGGIVIVEREHGHDHGDGHDHDRDHDHG